MEVYSHSSTSDWHRTFVDLREGSPTCFTDEYLEDVWILSRRPKKLAHLWVQEHLGDFLGSGTVSYLLNDRQSQEMDP